MSASSKIQIVLLASLLWSSTSLSSFSAHATTPKTNQSVTIQIPDNLIAGEMRDMLSRSPQVSNTFYKFDEIWKNPANRQQSLLDYCNTTQKDFSPDQCLSVLTVWIMDKDESDDYRNSDELMKIIDEIRNIRSR